MTLRLLQTEQRQNGALRHLCQAVRPDSIGAVTLVQIRLNILERQNRNDEYLNLAKATGHWQAYLTRLIDLGQLELAMIQAKQHLDSKMTALAVAQALREQGALEQALEIAKAGLTLPGPGKAQLGCISTLR